MDMQKIGQFLAALRKCRGLTQQEVADRLGVSDKTVSKWECGNGLPDITAIPAIAELFEVTADEILCGERILRKPTRREEKKMTEQVAYYILKKLQQFKMQFMVISFGMAFVFLAVLYFMNNDSNPSFYILMLLISLFNVMLWNHVTSAIKKLKRNDIIKQSLSNSKGFRELTFTSCFALFFVLYVLVLSLSSYFVPLIFEGVSPNVMQNQWFYHILSFSTSVVGSSVYLIVEKTRV